jgi:hypothetical protein
MAVSLRTARLLLRPWRDADLVDFAAMSADPAVMEFLAPLAEPGAARPGRRGCGPIGGITALAGGSSKFPIKRVSSGSSVSP